MVFILVHFSQINALTGCLILTLALSMTIAYTQVRRHCCYHARPPKFRFEQSHSLLTLESTTTVWNRMIQGTLSYVLQNSQHLILTYKPTDREPPQRR